MYLGEWITTKNGVIKPKTFRIMLRPYYDLTFDSSHKLNNLDLKRMRNNIMDATLNNLIWR